jgi:hypothetical protein
MGLDLPRLCDEAVGLPRHGGHYHHELMPLGVVPSDPAGHVFDAFGGPHGGSTVFLHNESHGCNQ